MSKKVSSTVGKGVVPRFTNVCHQCNGTGLHLSGNCSQCYGTGREGGMFGHVHMLGETLLARIVRRHKNGALTIQLLEPCKTLYKIGEIGIVSLNNWTPQNKE